MTVITFANTKGGAGKTTAVAIIACELARMGYSTKLLDADPQCWISKWCNRLGERAPNSLSTISYVNASNIVEHINAARKEVDFVLVDLPGARSSLLAHALSNSQYAMIPVQGSATDAEGAANVIELLQYLDKRANIKIPYSVVLTRVNPMVTTRALQNVMNLLASRHVHVFSTPIIERAAYRDVFGAGETLYTIDPAGVSNLAKAQVNAQELANEFSCRVLSYCQKQEHYSSLQKSSLKVA